MFALFLSLVSLAVTVYGQCQPSVTTAEGPLAPSEICSGQLIFEDNFDTFDLNKWTLDRTMWGGGNGEFQWYDSHPENSYIEDGSLWLKPTLTADYIGGEELLWNSTLVIPDYECNVKLLNGCTKTGSAEKILPPIRSAAVRTWDSFWFTYGKVEIRAKIPTGDWLWPALWMLPKYEDYGPWPYSGEIDILEARGNLNYIKDGVHIGVEQVGQTIHFPYEYINYVFQNPEGYNKAFHTYGVEWRPDGFQYYIDGEETVFIPFGRPFNKPFYIIMNLAVGGIYGYFPEDAYNEYGRSWRNDEDGMTMFWRWRKNTWWETWNLGVDNNKNASFGIDYVKVWAL